MLQAEDILKNFEKHKKIVDTYITDRKDSVLAMLDSLGENYVMASLTKKS